MYVSKDALNHFLVHSSAKSSLRRAKNVLFVLFSILVDRIMEEAIAPPAPPLATLLLPNISEDQKNSYCLSAGPWH